MTIRINHQIKWIKSYQWLVLLCFKLTLTILHIASTTSLLRRYRGPIILVQDRNIQTPNANNRHHMEKDIVSLNQMVSET